MSVDIKHLRALLDKATPGPWIYSQRDKALSTGQLGADGHVYDGTDWRPVVDTVSESIKADDDGLLIAAARNALPALLDRLEGLEDNDVEVRSLAKSLDETAGELESLQDDIDEHLPEYVLDDGTDEPANYRERIEYAGQEIKRLQREVHRHQHGTQIEGDYVCAAELALANSKVRIKLLERIAETAWELDRGAPHARHTMPNLLAALAALDEVTP